MGHFITAEAARQRIRALLDALDAAHADMRAVSSQNVGTSFRVELAERLEHQQRVNRALMYRVCGELADPPDEAGAAAGLVQRLAARLRIPTREVKRRIRTAGRIRPRRQLSGPALPPLLPAAAEALESGALGEDHLQVIAKTMDRLPSCTSVTDRTEVEASLVREAGKNDADFVAEIGRHLDDLFNPDGHFDESDRARRRGLALGRQGVDGMSQLSGWIDPETRTYLEAVTAAVRPGRHLPDGARADTRDDRSMAQRRHDGLKLGLKAGIASGQLGSHRGHPVTVIVRTTLAELNQAAHAVGDPAVSMPGPARTGGGSALPMRDLIRMATDAIHYLAVFDNHTERPLYLGRQARIATTDQRMICYARDGGCTRPGCLAPGYECEVHHSPEWSAGGRTDADELFFACSPDHTLVTDGHWKTEVTSNGRLGWTENRSSAQSAPRVNRAHHADELLRGDPDPPRSG